MSREARVTWGLIATIWVIAALASWSAGFAIRTDLSSAWIFPVWCVGSLIVAAASHLLRRGHKLVAPFHCLAQLLALSAGVLVLQYPAAGLSAPLIDAHLASLDRGLGFDWPGFFWWAFRHEPWQSVLRYAYMSFSLQLLAACFIGLDSPARLRLVVLANAIALIICATVSALLPAAGAFAYYHPAGIVSEYVDTFLAVRSGSLRVIDPDAVQGIIQFPSYHAASSALMIYGFAAAPKPIALAVSLWQATIIVAAVPMGGHHLVDVVAGIGVAILALGSARFMAQPRLAPAPVAVTR